MQKYAEKLSYTHKETHKHRNIRAWFSSFTPASFITVFQLTNNLVRTISRSVCLSD